MVLLPFTCWTAARGCVTLTQRWDMPGGLLVSEGNMTPHTVSAVGSSLGTKPGPNGPHKCCVSLQMRFKLWKRNGIMKMNEKIVHAEMCHTDPVLTIRSPAGFLCNLTSQFPLLKQVAQKTRLDRGRPVWVADAWCTILLS